jgi:hypothetical protein
MLTKFTEPFEMILINQFLSLNGESWREGDVGPFVFGFCFALELALGLFHLTNLRFQHVPAIGTKQLLEIGANAGEGQDAGALNAAIAQFFGHGDIHADGHHFP